jgi:hypothetical protein
MKALKDKVPTDAFLMVVITMEDLYDDNMWDFSLGKEFKNHHAAILSMARYDPAFWRNVDIPSEYVKDYNDTFFESTTKPPALIDDFLLKWRAMARVDTIRVLLIHI